MQPLNGDARNVLDAMAASGNPPLESLPTEHARVGLAMGFAALQGPKTELPEVRDLKAPGPAGEIPLRLYRPSEGASLPAVIYFHGGGFVLGDIETHDSTCRLLSQASGCIVISVDYRLGPENRFPAAPEDCFAATQWIAAHAGSLGIDAKRIAVSGDSAGGNLAAVVALMARDAKGPAITHQMLLYPVTGWDMTTDSYRNNGEGYFLTTSLMAWFGANYVRSEADVKDWRCSPLLAPSLAGLPSATVIVLGYDPLRDEGVAYAKALQAAGVETELVEYAGQIHGFISMDGAVAEARTAIQAIGDKLKRVLA